MKRKDRFDQIVIETTGPADPAPVAQTLFVDDEIAAQLRLDATATSTDSRLRLFTCSGRRPSRVVPGSNEQSLAVPTAQCSS